MLSHDNKTYDAYAPGASQHQALETFHIFKKGPSCFGYENTYNDTPPYDEYVENDQLVVSQAYHELLSPTDTYYTNEWKQKFVADWTPKDTIEWIVETAHKYHFNEYEIPLSRFRESNGATIMNYNIEDWINQMQAAVVNSQNLRAIAETLSFELDKKIKSDAETLRSKEEYIYQKQEMEQYYQESSSLTDLDRHSEEIRKRLQDGCHDTPQWGSTVPWDSEEDTKERLHDAIMTESTSPECGSENSKSGDERDDKRIKRPPGRPRGTGKKADKRIKNVSVPEFLKELLHNPMYCPSIIKWEEYEIGKFRFVRPNDVARLWGDKKRNTKMSFEKFSRAMRYHYKQGVLISVPTARLVYQFGPNAPNYRTDNPNFARCTPSSIIRSNPNYSNM